MIQIYRPIKVGKITQTFGQNLVPFYKNAGLKGHNGIDFSSFIGQPVYFPIIGDKEIIWKAQSYETPTTGLMVCIWSSEPILYDKRVKMRFLHLSKANIGVQKIVTPGQIIGYTGNSGKYTTGPHLHMDIGFANENGSFKETDNGYGGPFNPNKLFKNEFPFDANFTTIENIKADLHRIKELVGLA